MSKTLNEKFSPSQKDILAAMQDGFRLSVFGCFSGHVSYVHICKLEKDTPEGPYQKKEIRVKKAPIDGLEKRGYIKVISSHLGGASEFALYGLTEKGKTAKV